MVVGSLQPNQPGVSHVVVLEVVVVVVMVDVVVAVVVVVLSLQPNQPGVLQVEVLVLVEVAGPVVVVSSRQPHLRCWKKSQRCWSTGVRESVQSSPAGFRHQASAPRDRR